MATHRLWICALACCLAASCSDATAPAGTIEVTVSPDTVRLPESGEVRIFYVRRNLSSSDVRILAERIDVMSEISPGDWRITGDIPDPYAHFALRDSEARPPRGDASGLWSAAIGPGRYRLHYWYQLARADGSPSGDHRAVDSNVFVVIPR